MEKNELIYSSIFYCNIDLCKMPRTYVRKRHSHYSEEDLKTALNLIRDKKLAVGIAAGQYHIPRQTLYARLSGCRGNRKPGAATILSNDEEKFLIHVIHKYQEWQMPLTRSDSISIARTFMIEFDKQKYYERFVM